MNDFGHLIEMIYWTLGLGLGAYIAHSLSRLNERVAAFTERSKIHEHRLDGHDEDLKELRIKHSVR